MLAAILWAITGVLRLSSQPTLLNRVIGYSSLVLAALYLIGITPLVGAILGSVLVLLSIFDLFKLTQS